MVPLLPEFYDKKAHSIRVKSEMSMQNLQMHAWSMDALKQNRSCIYQVPGAANSNNILYSYYLIPMSTVI